MKTAAAEHVREWLMLAAMAAMAAMAAPVQAQIYKCPQPGGGTVIQQVPCAGGNKLDVKPASGYSNDASAATAKAAAQDQTARVDHRVNIRAAINRHEPIVGMSIAEVQQALGAPTRVNRANYMGSLQDQAIFERDNGTWYVYTRDGVVTSIQHDDPIRVHARPRCPSAMELRSARVSANAISATDYAHERYQSLLDQQRDCQP